MSFNKIIIVGYLGRDPELRYTPQGTPVCTFSVATTERRKSASGEPEEITTWFRVSAWNRLAELANEYLAKGQQVYVEGRLRTGEYTDRDGRPRTTLEVTATELHFLGQREQTPETASREESKPVAAKAAAQPTAKPQPPEVPIEDSDIPF